MSSSSSGGSSPFARLYTAGLVVTTFCSSVALLNLTKWIYVQHQFKYPLFLTATHMVASYCIAGVMIFGLKLVPNRRVLNFREQVSTVVPFSLLGASSIACGNMALVYLYPSLHEMIQNTTPVGTVLCCMVILGARYNTHAYLALIPVTFGGALCAAGEEADYAMIGLVISIGAVMFRSLRVIVQGNLMRGQEPIDSVSLLFYAAPFNTALFLVGSALKEGMQPWMEFPDLSFNGKCFIVGAASTAAMYNLLSFLMVGHLGAVGSMVMHNLKTPGIIVASTIIFGNTCTVMQMVGFLTASVGVYSYNAYGKEVDSQREPKCQPQFGNVVGNANDDAEFGPEMAEELDKLKDSQALTSGSNHHHNGPGLESRPGRRGIIVV